jgi:hypothetical protein
MKWKNAKKDDLPPVGKEVLISVDGVYYIAVYQDTDEAFRVRNREWLKFLLADHLIYWAELD